MDKRIYIECAKSVTHRLYKEINGKIVYEIYPEVDTIVFKVVFKDFDFHYAANNIQEIIYNDGFDDVINVFLSKYKHCILNAFFKSDEKKERERLQELGINEDVFV